jgi:hypothetical protein
MKYNYARKINTVEGEETFSATECASFDEAQKYVEKGIYDRKLQLVEKYPGNSIGGTSGFTPQRPQIHMDPAKSPVGSPTGGKIGGDAPSGHISGPANGAQGQH